MIKIETVEMPTEYSRRSKGFSDALKKLGIKDNTSFFIPLLAQKSLVSLKASVNARASQLGMKVIIIYEFKYTCDTCGTYILRENIPRCGNCKLPISGIRVWRIA